MRKFNVRILLPIFLACSISVFSQPAYDNCSNAYIINNLNNWCSGSGQFTNVGATYDGFPTPVCWGAGTFNDVWFVFTATGSSVNVSINGANTGGGTLNYPMVEMLSGNCGALNGLPGTCTVASAANPGFVTFNKSGLIIGQQYYIHIDGQGSNTGTFQLCINNYTPAVAPGQDCATASFLCNTNTITQTSLLGAGTNPDEAAGSCWDIIGVNTETNSAWYTWTAANNGALTFTIFPNLPDDDIDFVLYQMNNNDCNQRTQLRCEASSCPGQTGINMTSVDVTEVPDDCSGGSVPGHDNFVQYVNMVQGQTYALLINNYTSPLPGAANGFTLQFGGTGQFQGPVAAFSYTPASACLFNNSFTFTDQSTGGVSYLWDFGIGANIPTGNTPGPYTITYSTPGIKTIVLTITGNGGCSVVEYHTVTITDPSVNLGNDTSICPGNNVVLDAGSGFVSYQWSTGSFAQSITVNSAGTYSVTVNDGICSANDAMVISYNAGATLTTSSTNAFCGQSNGSVTVTTVGGTGPFTYLWNTNPPQNTATAVNLPAGAYIVTVSDQGCTSSDTAVIININGPALDTASTVAHCGLSNGSVTVTPSGGTPPYTYSWNTILAQTTPTAINLNAGTYLVTVTDANNCMAYTSVTVAQIPLLTLTLTGTDVICYGQNNGSIDATVSGGVPGYTFLWSNGAVTEDINNIPAGTYIVTIIDADICTISDTITISEPPQLVLTASPDQLVCNNVPAVIFATVTGGTGAHSCFWNGVQDNDTLTVALSTDATYYVFAVDANGCYSDTGVITLNVLPPLSLDLSTGNDSICPGAPAFINAFISGGDGGPYFLSNQNNDTVSIPYQVYPDVTTKYTLFAGDNCGATASDTITIHVIEKPKVFITANKYKGCKPLTVTFHEEISDNEATYLWDFGDEQAASSAHFPTHTFEDYGVYDITLTVTSKQGCVNSATTHDMITVYQLPEAKFTYDPETVNILEPFVSFQNLSQNADVYLWSFGDGDSSLSVNPAHTYGFTGSFSVNLTAISEHECIDTTSATIKVKDVFTIYAPTAFSPFNNDGVNDKFMITGHGISPSNFALYIYDRWGELIFSSGNLISLPDGGVQSEQWNGSVKNKAHGTCGAYAWLVIFKDITGVIHDKSGNVTLIR